MTYDLSLASVVEHAFVRVDYLKISSLSLPVFFFNNNKVLFQSWNCFVKAWTLYQGHLD